MPVTPVPSMTDIPDFPSLADRAAGTYNSKAFAFGTHMSDTFNAEIEALAQNVHDNATDAESNAIATAADAVATAADRVQTGLDAAATAADRIQTGLDRAAAEAAAAAASGSAAFLDTNPIVKGSADATKQVRFEVDGLTSGQTRVLTVPDADLTLVGAATVQTLTNKTFTGYTETVYALAGTVLDPANGTVQTKTLTGNTTFTENIADGQSVVLMLNPATYSTTWPTTSWVNAAGTGAAPTLKASAMNVVVLWQVGGTLYGNWIGSL